MAERPVLVGLLPQAVVLEAGDQASWFSNAGNLKVEFDANRCPFASNIFQAPAAGAAHDSKSSGNRGPGHLRLRDTPSRERAARFRGPRPSAELRPG